MRTPEVARLVIEHLVEHDLPEPASLYLAANLSDGSEIRIQVHGNDLTDTAGLLLAWATTLTGMTLRAWRPEDSQNVHLNIDATLTGPASTVKLTVYGGTLFDAAVFPGLESGQERPVSLGQLTTWAAGTGVEVAA
jgi:hypothetical protein